MRRWLVTASLVGGMLLAPRAALACDPDADSCDAFVGEDVVFDAPAWEPPALEPRGADAPAFDAPAYDPPARETVAYEAPAAPAAFDAGPAHEAPTVDPGPSATIEARAAIDGLAPIDAPPSTAASQAAARGLYAVTDVYAGDYVITRGDTTTFGSRTVAMDAHTFAQKVAVVGSGEASALDGLSMNARMTRSDGGGVAGTFYETFICDAAGCVSVGLTFFADDSETRRATPPSPVVAVAAVPPPTTATAAAPAIPGTTPGGGSAGAPIVTTPSFVEQPGGGAGGSGGGAAPTVPSAPASGLTPEARRDVRAGVALAPQADVLGAIEVLRGRRIPLWLRATVDGAPAQVLGWRLASGEVVALGAVSGSADDPLVATWRTLAPRGAAFGLRFDVSVDVPGEGARSVDAVVAVVVRSPALVE